ncbi:osteoclast-stimulating factor 1 isoform X1 [Panthera onca]
MPLLPRSYPVGGGPGSSRQPRAPSHSGRTRRRLQPRRGGAGRGGAGLRPPGPRARVRPRKVRPFLIGGARSPASPGASLRRPPSASTRSAAARAAARAARAPAAPELPAREPISARRPDGCHFLVARPRAREARAAAGRGGARRRAALTAFASPTAKGGRRSLKAYRRTADKKKLWGPRRAGWRGVRLAFRAWSRGPAAPGSAMSKPPPKPVKPGQVKVFRALYTFEPRTPDELYFEEGDIIYITDMSDTNWWKGTSKGKTGLIPSNYVAEQAESIDNPLHEAAKRGNLSWLRECLDNRVGVNGLDKAGSTALYWACHGGHKDIVEMLFTQPNIELNQQNKLGDTALHAAAWKGYADIVHLLLEKGARTDLRNNEKKLALDMATNAACASLLKKKQGTDAVRTLSNAEEYLDDEDSD